MQKARNGAWKLCQSKENPAITRFESVSCEPNLRLFILKPQTGKTHQLRVAMKSLGSPILGDTLYGKNTENIDRTYLHAARLQFEFKGQAFDVFTVPKEGEWWHRDAVQSQIQNLAQQVQSQLNRKSAVKISIILYNSHNFFTLGIKMKFISFNINGLRARPHQLEAIIEKYQPDVIGLQEIKVADEDFPYAITENLGYHVFTMGKKGITVSHC